MSALRDEFLSAADLDLRSLSWEELLAYWDLWLEQAQASNDLDRDTYSHGVFAGASEAGLGAMLPAAEDTGVP
jgi:hypothetical protein